MPDFADLFEVVDFDAAHYFLRVHGFAVVVAFEESGGGGVGHVILDLEELIHHVDLLIGVRLHLSLPLLINYSKTAF